MKMYRKVIYILTLSLSFQIIHAQGSNDKVVIRGYVVAQYKKKEVVEKQTNAANGIIPIDYFVRVYYLPFDNLAIYNSIDSLNRFRPYFEVFLPPAETKEMIKEFCKNDIGLFTDNFALQSDSDRVFFRIENDSYKDDLFQFYFFECKAIKTIIPNNYDNTFLLNVPYVKPLKNLNCYFVYDTLILQQIEKINCPEITRFYLKEK